MIIVILSLILFFYIIFKLFKYFSLKRDWFIYVEDTYMRDKITKEKKIVMENDFKFNFNTFLHPFKNKITNYLTIYKIDENK